jgi:ubiquinone/menaquinone biosynthesis C-methylase UbiE
MKRRVSHPIFSAVYRHLQAPNERTWLGPCRAELLGPLEGDVLEIGAGDGANVRYYRRARHVTFAEPDAAMRKRLEKHVGKAVVPTSIVDAPAESLPFDAGSFDVVVSALVLCTVADLDETLAEVKRVLRPGGKLAFIEHVRKAGDEGRWQDRLRPAWSFFLGGCQLNRDSIAAIERAGFVCERLSALRPKEALGIIQPIMVGVASRPDTP